jgi:hypothetical protein
MTVVSACCSNNIQSTIKLRENFFLKESCFLTNCVFHLNRDKIVACFLSMSRSNKCSSSPQSINLYSVIPVLRPTPALLNPYFLLNSNMALLLYLVPAILVSILTFIRRVLYSSNSSYWPCTIFVIPQAELPLI